MKKSDCCDAEMKVEGDTTNYHVCTDCGMACDTSNIQVAQDKIQKLINNPELIEKAARYSAVSQEIQMMIWDYIKQDMKDRDAVSTADKIIKLVLKNKDKL